MKNKGNNPNVNLAHPGMIDAKKQSVNNPRELKREKLLVII
jgi:hypothetical protein